MYVYDCEVFAHDWLVIFKRFLQDEWHIIHNDPDTLREFVAEDPVCIGFNSKTYDMHIIKGILLGMDYEQVKQLNDWLIDGNDGWDYPPLMDAGYIRFRNVDIMNDMQLGMSLKAIECHLGMSVQESSVPFDIPRPLTKQELQQTIHYCRHDVQTTERVVQLREKYLQTKIDIGKMAGMDEYDSMKMTNAKLTAALLKARRVKHTDERDYVFPANLKTEYIPADVMEFFDKIHDRSIPDEKYFKSKKTFGIGDCKVVIGMGGIHGAIDHYIWKEGEQNE